MLAGLSRRDRVLGVLLAATLAVSAWTLLDTPQDPVVEPAVRTTRAPGAREAHRAATDAAADANGALALAQRPVSPPTVTNLFGSYSYQAGTVAAVAPTAARPHAPPLPFTYTGRLEIDGRETYLFLQGDAPISASVGTVIGDFTLEQANGQTLVFVHGPSGERVSVPIGAVNG